MALTEITSKSIKNSDIATEDIANDAITGDKIADDSITGALIADDAVGAEHIETLDSDVFFADNSSVVVGAGSDGIFYSDGDNAVIRTALANNFEIQSNQASGGNHTIAKFKANNAVELYYDDAKKFETVTGGATITGTCSATVGAFTDITGRHGRAPTNAQGSTYTLVVTDAGKVVKAAGNVTIDQNVFSDGDMLVIYNSSSGDITLIQGTSFTLRLAGDSATGTRTIAQKGVCTVINVAANEAVAGGIGVS
tara:strand:+ start:5873 stop:6631 length:759 start_codon:yes stop_codon:yes gene_type:complete